MCNLKILHKIQRSAELCISGPLRTNATGALNTILDLEPRTDWDNLQNQFENAVNIYTDGSKLNSQTAGLVFFPELGIKVSFRLPDHCSVLQAEVMAIQEAMSHLDTSEHHDIDIFIFSDSQAALLAPRHSKLNKEERYSRVPRLSDTRYSKGNGDMQAAKRN